MGSSGQGWKAGGFCQSWSEEYTQGAAPSKRLLLFWGSYGLMGTGLVSQGSVGDQGLDQELPSWLPMSKKSAAGPSYLPVAVQPAVGLMADAILERKRLHPGELKGAAGTAVSLGGQWVALPNGSDNPRRSLPEEMVNLKRPRAKERSAMAGEAVRRLGKPTG